LVLKPKGRGDAAAQDDDDVVLSAMDQRIEQRFLTPWRIGVAAGALALVGLAVYGYVEFGLNRTLTVGAERVTIARVSYDTFREYIPVTGNVVPRTTVYLDAIEGGQITAVHVEEGAVVTAGQPLVTFKNSNLELQVIGAEAQLTEQLNYLSTTRQNFEQSRLRNQRELIDIDYQIDRLTRDLGRRRPLVATGGATKGQVDDLEAELTRYRGLRGAVEQQLRLDEEFGANQLVRMSEALDSMNKKMAIARDNLSNLVIVAPIDGQLTLLEANTGESKARGQRVGQVDELDAFKVFAFVDEFYLSRVVVGQLAEVEIDGKSYELEVTKEYPGVRDRQFEIDLKFVGDASPQVRRGQTVRMRLEIGQPADTLVLANGAFYDDTGGQWVFVVDESGDYAVRRDVRFGRRNPEGVEVLHGLREGERVITSSYESFERFDRIQFNGGA
ncbi:MAG TPA: HlyD family efflux transporter periplasmic adaptor subunit, partial [Gammaproteobacteria bacterium]